MLFRSYKPVLDLGVRQLLATAAATVFEVRGRGRGLVAVCGRVVDVGAPTPLLARELVGRDGEIDRLREAWRAGGAVRVVRGPAGVVLPGLMQALDR